MLSDPELRNLKDELERLKEQKFTNDMLHFNAGEKAKAESLGYIQNIIVGAAGGASVGVSAINSLEKEAKKL